MSRPRDRSRNRRTRSRPLSFRPEPPEADFGPSLIARTEEKQLKFVVVGEAGQGKSTLINGLLGEEVAYVRNQVDAGTAEIKHYSLGHNAVKIWEIPGVGFSTAEDKKMVEQQLRSSDCFPHDLALFCFRMDGTRFPTRVQTDTVKMLTQVFGRNFWKHTVFVLTFANAVLHLCPKSEEMHFFSNRVTTLEKKIHEMLRETIDGLSENVIRMIPAIPVGSYKKGGYNPENPWRLPDREDWFHSFWIECTKHMRQSSLSALIQANRYRETTKQSPMAQSDAKQRLTINELIEKLQLEELKCEIYKQDFETERNDRQRLHQTFTGQIERLEYQCTAAQTQCEELEQKYTTDIRKLNSRIETLEEEETYKITEIEELNTLVTAYSHELTQSQAEVARMQQQLDQEHTKRKNEIEGMRNANKVLMERVLALNQSKLVLEGELRQAKEENASLRNEMSKLQSSWKVNYKDVTLLKEELGKGAWGVVWVGQFRGHPVAVKELHEAIRSPLYLENLHREINTMSQLRHPNLLQFIGAVLDHPSGNPMIITEVMDTSLRKAYENKELTSDPGCRPVILSIMRDVAVGLNYLHCLPDPIIHRDVSSANVLLESKGDKKWKTKISDFGSAKVANKAVSRLPGAEPYTAPEAIAQHIMSTDSKKLQTTKMDVFSYGVLLCEIITCRFPDRDVFRDMLRQVQSISSRPVRSRKTQGSLLHSLIVWCCHDDPLQRPSMSQIIEQIDVISM